jgi:hypothetical protein
MFTLMGARSMESPRTNPSVAELMAAKVVAPLGGRTPYTPEVKVIELSLFK